jgi:hypothetical protein
VLEQWEVLAKYFYEEFRAEPKNHVAERILGHLVPDKHGIVPPAKALMQFQLSVLKQVIIL